MGYEGTDSFVPQPIISPDTVGSEVETTQITRPDAVLVQRQRVEITDDLVPVLSLLNEIKEILSEMSLHIRKL